MNKFLKGCSCCLIAMLLFFCIRVDSRAMSVSSTYADVVSTSTQAENLYNLAKSYDSFDYADFVIFRDTQYSYYIVWGDLEESSGTVTGFDVEFVRYYTTTTSGYSSNYVYEYGSDSSFSLTSDYVVVSNLDNYGMRFSQYETESFYKNSVFISVLACSMIFAIMLKNFVRR